MDVGSDATRAATRPDAFSYYRRLERVRSYCESHYAEDLPLARVAAVAHLERTYFSSFFRDKVGITFREWLRKLRILEAQKLLCCTELTVTQIATRVGYNGLGTFERAFKLSTGCTPADFRGGNAEAPGWPAATRATAVPEFAEDGRCATRQ